MNIKILGTGCARCHALAKTVKKALEQLNIDATVEEVKDINKILKYPILTTPGLVINEQVASSGRVLKTEEIKKMITDTMIKEGHQPL